MNLLSFILYPLSLCTTGKNLVPSSLHSPFRYRFNHIDNIPPEPSVLQAESSQVSQLLLIEEMHLVPCMHSSPASPHVCARQPMAEYKITSLDLLTMHLLVQARTLFYLVGAEVLHFTSSGSLQIVYFLS